MTNKHDYEAPKMNKNYTILYNNRALATTDDRELLIEFMGVSGCTVTENPPEWYQRYDHEPDRPRGDYIDEVNFVD